LNTGIYLEDLHRLNAKNFIHLSSRLSYQRDGVASDFGLKSLEIFYPDMPQYTNRFLFNASAKYHLLLNDFGITAGGGYGLRAPSVSEAYGYYLFNTFDNYDYIGNPLLKNEKSLEGNLALDFNKKKIKINWLTSYFHFFDYIIGKPAPSLTSMTVGASGVKTYTNLNSATIFTSNLQVSWLPFENFTWMNNVSYSLGRDEQNNPLPLIAPVMYASDLQFHKNKFSADIQLKGAAKHVDYAPEYGENETPAYAISNFSAGYNFTFNKCSLYFKLGVENIFDKKYTTYADWNNILQKGRNYFINVMFGF
jgi:iron complex outermembrane receptor protein